MSREHKVVLVGEASVGKTALSARFRTQTFQDTESTIGCANAKVDVDVDGKTVVLDLWDTAGQERFRSLTPIYFQGAEAAVFVYDVTNAQSAQGLESFYAIFQQRAQENCTIVIVGNKVDLESQRRVQTSEGEDLAKKYQAQFFFETSAKTGHAVDTLFTQIAQAVSKTQGNQPDVTTVTDIDPKRAHGKRCC